MTVEALAALPRRDLAALIAGGRPFDPARLAGAVYRGTSLGLPAWVERVTWRRFAKAFDDEGRGWNLRMEQDDPWRPRLRRGRRIAFGAFAVVPSATGVVLDYAVGAPGLRALRDPVVALDDDAALLLGRTLLALGGRALPTPSFFVLERDPALPLR